MDANESSTPDALAMPAATDCAVQTDVPQAECETLLDLYGSTNGPNWTNSTGWTTTNQPCSWYGVGCDDDHVVEVYQYYNGLSGPIPDLSALTSLQNLYLPYNQLSGPIPDLSNFTNLWNLNLSGNQLSGPIPDLSNLTSLQALNLSGNQLSGPIPDLSNLTSLQSIWLGDNELSGPIPDLSALTSLIYLWLGDNDLSGPIPDLSALTSLIYLDLGNNQLSGIIPASVCIATDELDLGYNRFTGEADPCVTRLDPDWRDTQAKAALRFRGKVYDGPVGDTSYPLSDVTMHLYGRNEGEDEPGSLHLTQQTALDGFFNFYIEDDFETDYFTLMAETPAGMMPIEAWSKDGTVVDAQTVQWNMPEIGVHENSFHFEVPTLAPTEPVTTTIELPLLTDTWVTWGDQDGNYDGYAALIARTTGLDNMLMVFDRTDLPQNAEILSAELTLNVSGQTGAEGKQLTVLNTEPFTPKAVTYADAPMNYNPAAAVDVPLAPGPLTFDVVSQIAAWDDPGFTSYHRGYLALSASGTLGRIIVDSLETYEGQPVSITVTYTAP